MYLVLLQSSSNQSFIFRTNKLRENVGASQLIFEAGTQLVLDRIGLWRTDPHERRAALRNQPPIENGGDYEAVVAASGNALVLARDKPTAQQLVAEVTRTVAVASPGLDVMGCILEVGGIDQVPEKIPTIYREFEALRGFRSGPAAAFQQIPVVAKCATSGLPASFVREWPEGAEDVSLESLMKTEAGTRWSRRFQALLPALNFPHDINDLEAVLTEKSKWVAVVHADTNGMGAVLQNFGRYLPTCPSGLSPARHYLNCLRLFSTSVDAASEAALVRATTGLPLHLGGVTPIVPLIAGGDDLTVVCAGSVALQFTRDYLSAFERETASLEGINPAKLPRLGASAGVALVKSHFPFHAAYDLAEGLVKSAKAVKLKAHHKHSAIDFHVLYDSTFIDLDEIRSRLRAADGAVLTGKPYVVSDAAEVPATPNEAAWFLAHHVDGLASRVGALGTRDDDGERAISRAQLHQLRSALFQGVAATNAAITLMAHRYPAGALGQLLESGDVDSQEPPSATASTQASAKSVFRTTSKGGSDTRLLDAMEIASEEFWSMGASS